MNQSLKFRRQTELLEDLYQKLNRPEFIHPDPLEFIHRYKNPADQEIVGLIAAVLAYGNVRQILASITLILSPMGESPRDFLIHHRAEDFEKIFKTFKHRWHTGIDLAALCGGLKNILESHHSLENLFRQAFESSHSGLTALSHLVSTLIEASPPFRKNLLPHPADGSACKRLLLYLRWMIRRDAVDPGVWRSLPSTCLVIPVDTHMHRLARRMRLTSMKQANLKAAIEITNAFRKFSPDDPVRYDFCLTRLGIRPSALRLAPGAPETLLRRELNEENFLREWKKT